VTLPTIGGNVISIDDWLSKRDSAWADREARSMGFKSYAELEEYAFEAEWEELKNNPEWKEYVRECRIHRRLERARKRP
jgi:hypothetical protein